MAPVCSPWRGLSCLSGAMEVIHKRHIYACVWTLPSCSIPVTCALFVHPWTAIQEVASHVYRLAFFLQDMGTTPSVGSSVAENGAAPDSSASQRRSSSDSASTSSVAGESTTAAPIGSTSSKCSLGMRYYQRIPVIAQDMPGSLCAAVTAREGPALSPEKVSQSPCYMVSLVWLERMQSHSCDASVPELNTESSEGEDDVSAGEKGKGRGGKPSLREAFVYLTQSRQIRCLAIMALAQGLSTNLIEIAWKSHLHMLHPSPAAYSVSRSLLLVSLALQFRLCFGQV